MELERRRAAGDCAFFIGRFVRIEDRDAPGTAVPFTLWPEQRRALDAFAKNRLTVVLKARQLGLTWLALSFAAWKTVFEPGYAVVALSKREDDARELTRRFAFILRHLPPRLTRPAGAPGSGRGVPVWRATADTVTLEHPGGEPSVFKSMPAAPDSGRSFTASLVLVDEWAFQQWARAIWRAAYPTVNRPGGGRLIGLSTMRRGSLFEEIWRKSRAGENGFARVFLGWQADPRRTPAWYEATRRELGDAVWAEYPATEEEALSSPGGAFFPELRGHIHQTPPAPLPPGCRRYITLDYGLDALAALWIAVDARNRARVYRELYKSGLIISEAAKAVLTANGGEPYTACLAPPDLWNARQETGRSAAGLFAEQGLPLTRTPNGREAGWLAVKEWLRPFEERGEQTGETRMTARLTLDEGAAPELWRCLCAIGRDRHNPNDTAHEPHELTHLPDSLRCFAAHFTAPPPGPRRTAERLWQLEEPRNLTSGVMEW